MVGNTYTHTFIKGGLKVLSCNRKPSDDKGEKMELEPCHCPTIRTVNTWQAGASGTSKLLCQREGTPAPSQRISTKRKVRQS